MRAARALWVLLGIAASVHVLVSPERHNLWPVFRKGALGWWGGRILYEGPDYFRYSPVFAALLAPFAALPGSLGNILFDVLGLALLFHAIRRLARTVFPEPVLSRNEPAVLALSLVGVVRSIWSSQAHTWTAAVIFLAAVALVERRWWLAAFLLALGVHLKLAPIVLAGVVAVLWPGKMSWRFAIALVTLALLPFFNGQPAAVIGMYRDCQARLRELTALRLPGVRDVLHVFESLNVALPPGAYRAIQVLGGLLVVGWAWRLQRREVPAEWLVSGCFAVTITYMLALGPAVEFVQFPLLAPWVGAAMLAARPRSGERRALAVLYAMTMVAGFGAVEDLLGKLIHSRAPESFITLGAIAFGVWVVLKWRRAAPSRDTKGFEEIERAFAKT